MASNQLTIAELALIVGGEVFGDKTVLVTQVSSLESAKSSDVSFLNSAKFEDKLNTTRAGCVLLSAKQSKPEHLSGIFCKEPYLAFALAAQALDSSPPPAYEISNLASIHPSAKIGDNVCIGDGSVIGRNCKLLDNTIIGSNCVIGENSTIGENTLIHSNVTIYHGVRVGASCIFHSGVVLGSDGFGFANDSGQWVKIPQTGGVSIGDRVEVGANSCIDRGALNDTIIEDGVKIDNLCHIAHNVFLGEDTAMAACSGIAGSTVVGKGCTFSGRTSVVGHLSIASKSHFTVGTIVSRSNAKAGVFSSGTGTEENRTWKKNIARFKQLDDMAKRLKKLERLEKDSQKKLT